MIYAGAQTGDYEVLMWSVSVKTNEFMILYERWTSSWLVLFLLVRLRIPIERCKDPQGKHNRRERNPLAIVMAPTREFARQVGKEFYKSAPELYTLCVYGGSPIQYQMSTLDRGVDVTVGTPGRVIDLLKRRGFEFI
ncbi:DEAD-box ATP-dependent RNA helicase 53, mitochondrial-like protein, partial [Tanacetum coccineum]